MGININIVRAACSVKGVTVLSKKCVTAQTILTFECPKCTATYKQSWMNFRRNKSGWCQHCNQPHGERNRAYKNLSAQERADRVYTDKLKAFRPWARAVIKRDGVCIVTGRKTQLVAHHLNNWAEFAAQRTDVGNGVTLTRKIHNDFHRRYGYNTTREQFNEFLSEYRAKQGR